MNTKYRNTRLLYRYRKITDFTIKELIKDELVVSSGDTFNDSHDMTIGYDLEKVSKTLKENIRFVEAMANDSKRSKTYEERYEYLLSKKGEHSITMFANILCVECIKELKSKFLIASFTHKATNQVMWSHYADYGRGFLVGYKQSEITKSISLSGEYNSNELFNKIRYSYKVFDASDIIAHSILDSIKNKHIHNYSEAFINNLISSADNAYDNLFIKNPSWLYEKEVRLLVYDKQSHFDSHVCIAKVKPAVVIMGENISYSNKYLLASICRNKHIPIMVIESCFKNSKYELCIRPLLEIEIDNLLNKSDDILKLDGLID